MVNEYNLIKIIVPGVYYKKSKEYEKEIMSQLNPDDYDVWEEMLYADDMQNKVGMIINEFVLTNVELFYEQRAFSVYVDGLIVTLTGDQFEYI
jgi:hypothetical protein